MPFKLKILVTGKNKRISKDICEHCEDDRGYITTRCRPEIGAIFDVIHSEMPNVIIICMNDEIMEEVKAYNILSEAVASGALSVFVVANEEDKKFFMKYSELKKIYFLSRPISLFTLYEKLIYIESDLEKRQNEGSTFIEEYNNPNVAGNRPRRRVLVVDDDTEQLVHIKDQLEEFYDVSVVKSGTAALKFLSKKSVDVILLDYLMPDLDGPETLKMIRENEKLAEIPIIFLTGVSEKKKVIETITELKPQGYVVKPAKKSKIVAKIIDVIG